MVEALEACLHTPQRILLSVPPQHGKTELVKHALVWLMMRDPRLRHAYASYESKRAWRINNQIRDLAERAGFVVSGGQEHWSNAQGGAVMAAGINGPLTGEPVDGVLLVDDPHKGRKDAESSLKRSDVRDWYNSTAEPRVHPRASVVVLHTRWHPDDLIGQLAKEEDFSLINIPAVDTEGNALWEAHRPLDWLDKKRRVIGEYDWAALYMGQPRPRGGAVFGEPAYYRDLPPDSFTSGHGCDLAYTAKTHADFSVCVTMLRHGDMYYVRDVVRRQVDAPGFALSLKTQLSKYPGRMLWHCSGTEKGAAQFIRKSLGARFQTKNAGSDKFVRSQLVAAAWNDGRVLLPESAPWLDAFISEVCQFTGVADLHDDQVDAMASAFDVLQTATGTLKKDQKLRAGLPKRRI